MLAFAALCRDLFLLAQDPLAEAGQRRGTAWENRVADHLAMRGLPVEAMPGGCRIFGHASLSGLVHQIDGTIACPDALVIGEWKAHRGLIPKNEVLRFKAATDDFYMVMAGAIPAAPVMRVFGGAGRATRELRSYAALHGITVIDPEHWPAPLVAADRLGWPEQHRQAPSADDRRTLAWLSRPMQQVLTPMAGGAFLAPPAPSASRIAAALDLQDHWSARLWDAADSDHGWFEELRARTGTAA
jgi:hypothetical protein